MFQPICIFTYTHTQVLTQQVLQATGQCCSPPSHSSEARFFLICALTQHAARKKRHRAKEKLNSSCHAIEQTICKQQYRPYSIQKPVSFEL